MSTVIWFKNIRIEIRTKEKSHSGRPHCHAIRGEGKGRDELSIDLEALTLMAGHGFSKNDVTQIIKNIKEHREELIAKWREYHG
jgi:hypothetical protein